MMEKLKSEVSAKIDITPYGFSWLEEPGQEIDHFLALAHYTLSHKLNIVLAYHTKEARYCMYFDHPRLHFPAELSDDFFGYLHRTYILPAEKLGIHLSEEEYRNRRAEFKPAFAALTADFGDTKKVKEFSVFLGEEEWSELMTFLENNMIMNPMLTPHASIMHMATVRGGDFTASLTQASTAQFYISAPYSNNSSPFEVIFTYFPDKSKYNPVPNWIKTHKELAAVEVPMPDGIPKDFPIDAFGALYYLFGTP